MRSSPEALDPKKPHGVESMVPLGAGEGGGMDRPDGLQQVAESIVLQSQEVKPQSRFGAEVLACLMDSSSEIRDRRSPME